MAEQVGKMTAHIGGKQHAHELLVPLEQLAAVEESTVSFRASPYFPATCRRETFAPRIHWIGAYHSTEPVF